MAVRVPQKGFDEIRALHTCGWPYGTEATREACLRCREIADKYGPVPFVPAKMAEAIWGVLIDDGSLCVQVERHPRQLALPGFGG